jgi:hypothetical protein
VVTFGLDPNSNSHTIAHGGTGSTSVSTSGISTNNPNDVIYACAYTESTGLTYSISDSSGLSSWTARGTVTNSNGGEMECWYAVSTGTLSNDVITVNVQTGTNSHGLNVEVFSVSGANTASPFDPHLSSAVSAFAASSGTSSTVSITTTNSHDLIVGMIGLSSSPNNLNAGGSFNLLDSTSHSSASSADEYNTVTTAQPNLSVGFTWSGSSYWVMLADAFVSG